MSTTNALAVVQPQYEDEQMLATIRDTVCKGATPAQFRMFIEVCKATGLNPFLKEIWYVPSVGVMAGRDGYLRKANEHPQFDGMETRVERDDNDKPIKAVCTVWRKDRGHPVICEAYYNEYKKGGNVWNTYPSAMIAKVAEVLALKRSFAINGVVTEEEVGSSEERGSKEAQREYLAEKGLEPYSAKQAALEKQKPVPAAISEWANIEPNGEAAALDLENADRTEGTRTDPLLVEMAKDFGNPFGIKGLELRHAATVAETDAVLKDVAKPAKRKRGQVSFDVLKHFGEIKKLLREATADDSQYYAILQANGFTHADEITDNDKAREIYRAMGLAHKRVQEEKKLRLELEMAHMQFGVDFMDLLGGAGCETIDDVLALASEPLEALRKQIKALGVTST